MPEVKKLKVRFTNQSFRKPNKKFIVSKRSCDVEQEKTVLKRFTSSGKVISKNLISGSRNLISNKKTNEC